MHESLSVPPLSSRLIAFATIPLPTSNLFHEASCSADALDESDLYLWERDPPYNYPEPFMTADEVCYTQNMVDVLIGRRWRLAKVARDERALCFANGKVQDLLDDMVKGLVGRIDRWITVASRITMMEESGRNRVMADCWLHWQARDIFTDSEEVKALKNRENPYCTELVGRNRDTGYQDL